MLAALSTLSCTVVIHLVLCVCVNSEQRIRNNNIDIDIRPRILRRSCSGILLATVNIMKHTRYIVISYIGHSLRGGIVAPRYRPSAPLCYMERDTTKGSQLSVGGRVTAGWVWGQVLDEASKSLMNDTGPVASVSLEAHWRV